MADRTFLRIQLGRRLVEVRKRAGKTALDAIQAGIVRSKAQMSRLENGYRVQLTLANIAALCDLYGLAGQDKYYLQQMYLKAENDEEWWEPYSEVMFRDISLLFSLERYASRIHIFDNLVNGLFQTKGYAEMMHLLERPDIARKKVALRMERQADFWSLASVPQVQLMIPETALLGDCDEKQIKLLVERDRRPGISIRYLPASEGPLPYLKGPFTVIEFEGDDPNVVYSESISGARYEDQPVAVDAHLATFASHFNEHARSIKEFRRD